MNSMDPLQPPHDAVPLHPVATEVVAEWPPGTFLENLALDSDGESWLVTGPFDQTIHRVCRDGAIQIAAKFDQWVTGIVSHPQGPLAAVGTQGQAGWRLYRITDGAAQAVCELPGVLFANGMTWARGRLLVVDSLRSMVLAVDTAAGPSSVWLEHPLLTPVRPDSPMPGINGIAVHDGWVVITNTQRGLLLRVPLETPESPQPRRDLEVLAEGLSGDDLAIMPDGRIMVATHTFHSVLCLYPDGRREDIAGYDQGVAGPTADAVGPEATSTVYVSTTGGLLSPPRDAVEPARLLRMDVSAAGRSETQSARPRTHH
jgi:sugar lactone lactonase YvrE